MPRPDLDNLLNSSLDLAKEHLLKNGSFLPFGFILKDGKLELQMAYVDNKQSSSEELLGLLKKGIAEAVKDSEVMAANYTVDVNISDPQSEAIAVKLEERDNPEAVIAHLLYHKDRKGEIEFGNILFSKAEREFFKS